MTKSIKVALQLADDSIEYKDLFTELRQIQYLTAKACNLGMSMLYAGTQQEFTMKNAGMEIPKDKDFYGKSLRGYLYDVFSGLMTGTSSSVVSQTVTFITNQYRTDVKKGLLKGDVSLSSFKRNMPIYMRNDSFTLYTDDKGLCVRISFFNKEKAKELKLDRCSVDFRIPRIDDGQKSIIYRIINGEYKQGAASLKYNSNKKKWMLSISFSFTPKEKTGRNVLTVRLGTSVLFMLSVADGGTKIPIEMDRRDVNVPGLEELISTRSKFKSLRIAYGKATRVASDSKYGKGYRKRAQKFLKIKDKEHRFADTFNHKISRYIVTIAERYDCGAIEMEDFSNEDAEKAVEWSYYDIAQKVIYKAAEKGIMAVETSSKKEEESDSDKPVKKKRIRKNAKKADIPEKTVA